jgi:hypothetical protein
MLTLINLRPVPTGAPLPKRTLTLATAYPSLSLFPDIRLQFREEALSEELSTVRDSMLPALSSPGAGPISPAMQPITSRTFAPSPALPPAPSGSGDAPARLQ